jgi:hypothetical protein
MFKKLIAPVVLSGALLGSLAVGGVAYAAAPASTTTATATAPAAHHADKGKLRAWLKAHRKEIRAHVVTISAATIGVTPRALVAELKTGKSIAQVATGHHVDPSTVVTALSVAADAVVAHAVADHKLTPAQGARIDALLPARIAKIVDRVR